MGETAEKIAERTGITRVRQDEFACQSHLRAVSAQDKGRLTAEIIPVPVTGRKGEKSTIDHDERPRGDTTMEALARLKPAFRPDGTVTAGNSSGMNDGAAALLLMTRDQSQRLGLQPLVRIIASAACGVEPGLMGLGPIPATQKALNRAGLTIRDIHLFEVNEAFAVQALAVIEALALPMESTNVNGGAIALGHPLGCSGARILTTLVQEMKRLAPKAGRPFRGLATLCVGVGQGETTIVEWAGDWKHWLPAQQDLSAQLSATSW
jgi:acetyl-CoA acetyltransferase family protein